jgi:hypothetical protein
LIDYLHSLRRDGDPYGSQEDGKTGDRYGGQWNVEYTAKGKVTIVHLAYAERRIKDNGRYWRKDENLL